MPSSRHPWHFWLQQHLAQGPPRRAWRESVRAVAGADLGLRAAVFVAGLVLVLAGAALWMFSGLLTAPFLCAGLWVWSWEFAWARRWQHRFRRWLHVLWRSVRRQPARWVVSTAAGIASGAGGYWAVMTYGPM